MKWSGGSLRKGTVLKMYKHHEESIENMKEHFRKQGTIALILTGSVAKGMERMDCIPMKAVILTLNI